MCSNIRIIHGMSILTFVRNKSHELQLMISCHIANRNFWNQAEWWMLKPFDMNDGCFLVFMFWCSSMHKSTCKQRITLNVFDWINIMLSNLWIRMLTIFIAMINIGIAYNVWFYCYLLPGVLIIDIPLYMYGYEYC